MRGYAPTNSTRRSISSSASARAHRLAIREPTIRSPKRRSSPAPIQQPRVPIWVAGYWPNRRPFRRAARWDGVCPAEMEIRGPGDFRILPTAPATAATISAYIREHRTGDGPFDVVVSRALPEDTCEAAELLAAYTEAGVTWLLRDMLPWEVPLATARRIVRAGPPVP